MSHAIQSESTRPPQDILYSIGQPEDLPARTASLLSTWQLTESRKGLKQQFTFSSFTKAWQFMTVVAEECNVKNHHPEWSNIYNKVTIEWTTHRPEGLSIKDIEMAEFCDEAAAKIGLKK